MSWKMKDTMQVYKTIIRSQLIPIPIIWQLGPVDQHMLSDHFPVVHSLKTPFLLYSTPVPKAHRRAAAAGPRRPSKATLFCIHQKSLEVLWGLHFKKEEHAEDSEGEWGKPRNGKTQSKAAVFNIVSGLWTEKHGSESRNCSHVTCDNSPDFSVLTFFLYKIGMVIVPTLQGY